VRVDEGEFTVGLVWGIIMLIYDFTVFLLFVYNLVYSLYAVWYGFIFDFIEILCWFYFMLVFMIL
jgi:hypothetical protein